MPVRYDRELIQNTVKAMKRIAEIKGRREHAFWKNRCVTTLCSTLINYSLLFPLLHQNGSQQRETTNTSQDEDGETEGEDVSCQIGRAYVYRRYRTCRDSGKNQSAKENGVDCRRGSVNGYGYRLMYLHQFLFSLPTLFLRSFCIMHDLQSLPSAMLRNVIIIVQMLQLIRNI